MKKKLFRERRKLLKYAKEVVVLGAERPVIEPYDPKTKISVDNYGNIVEIKPKKKKKSDK
jgi:hypothetical protein